MFRQPMNSSATGLFNNIAVFKEQILKFDDKQKENHV